MLARPENKQNHSLVRFTIKSARLCSLSVDTHARHSAESYRIEIKPPQKNLPRKLVDRAWALQSELNRVW